MDFHRISMHPSPCALAHAPRLMGHAAIKFPQNATLWCISHLRWATTVIWSDFHCFCWFLDESRGVFSLRFGGQSVPNRNYFGTLLQLYYSKVGKLKTSVSPLPNTTFSSFEGLSRNILGDCCPTFFLGRVSNCDFMICLRNWGSSRSSKDNFFVNILGLCFTLIFDEFQGVPRIRSRAKAEGDLHGSGAPK